MKRILITGATGTVGMEVIRALYQRDGITILAGVRDLRRSAPAFHDYPKVQPVPFNFTDESTQEAALAECESLFLLRPPQVNDAFEGLIAKAKRVGVKHVVFLSVQGAEKNRLIPHHKTERLLQTGGIPHTLLRPAYFMQNFLTALHPDLVKRHLIFVPAGHARFALIDVRDIGRVAAEVLADSDSRHFGQAYTLTARRKLTFQQMADDLSSALGYPITYISPGFWKFYRAKRRQGLTRGMIFIMFLLHYLPRWTAEPPVTNAVAQLTGHSPTEFSQFVADNLARLRNSNSTVDKGNRGQKK